MYNVNILYSIIHASRMFRANVSKRLATISLIQPMNDIKTSYTRILDNLI